MQAPAAGRPFAFGGKWSRVLGVAALVLALVPSVAAARSQTLLRTLNHAGYARQYRLFIPTAYTPGTDMPLVFNFHGGGSTSSEQIVWSAMNTVAEREHFLVAYPDAINGAWFGPNRDDPYDDVGFVDDVLAQVRSTYDVDHARVYATGFSAGAVVCYVLGVQRPYAFGAVAPVSGVRPYAQGTEIYAPIGVPATPARPFPLLHVHGTGDLRLPYDGGPAGGWVWPPCEQVVNDYVRSNRCDLIPTVVDLPDVNTTDSSTVQRLTWGNGDAYVDVDGVERHVEVMMYRVVGGGHSWPGGSGTWPSYCLPVNRDVNASQLIWDFFTRHTVAAPVPEPSVGMAVLLIAAGAARRRHRA